MKGHFVGVDCGGSSTKYTVIDSEGKVVTSKSLNIPSNPNFVSDQRFIENVSRVLEDALSYVKGVVCGICFSLAGMRGGDVVSLVRKCVEKVAPSCVDRFIVLPDYEVAYRAFFDESSCGVAVISGTGSIAYAGCRGKFARVGGWGWIFGDEGSGFDIVRRLLVRAARAFDGRCSDGVVDLACRVFGIEKFDDIVYKVYVELGGERHRIASYAPKVIDEAERGDAAAEGIVREALKELAYAAYTACRRVGADRASVGFCGGIFSREFTRKVFIEEFSKLSGYTPDVAGFVRDLSLASARVASKFFACVKTSVS